MNVKEFADQQGITVQAVYHHLHKYKAELSGHVIRKGKQTQLDDFAVSFLMGHGDKTKQYNKTRVVYTDSKELERIKAEHQTEILQIREEYTKQIADRDTLISQKDATISAKDQTIAEKDQLILRQQQLIEELQSQKQSRSIWDRLFHRG